MNSTIIKRDVTTESQMQNRGCPQRKKGARKKETGAPVLSPQLPGLSLLWQQLCASWAAQHLQRQTALPHSGGNGSACWPPPITARCPHAPATPQPPGSPCLHISPLLHTRPRPSVVQMAFGCRPSERPSLTTYFNKPDVFQPLLI